MRRKLDYDWLLFDLDGTLTDPFEGITRSVEYALNAFGIEVEDRRTLAPFIGPPLVPSFMKYFGMTEDLAKEALRLGAQKLPIETKLIVRRDYVE